MQSASQGLHQHLMNEDTVYRSEPPASHAVARPAAEKSQGDGLLSREKLQFYSGVALNVTALVSTALNFFDDARRL